MAALHDDDHPHLGANGHDARPVRLHTSRKREAEEWVLVLVAEGYDARLERTAAGFGIDVPMADRSEATAIIEAWQAERAEHALPAEWPEPPGTTPFEMAGAYLVALGLLAFHLGLESSGRYATYLERGDSQAALVMAGQIWRTVTALTLHVDLAHAAGNTLFGGFFLAALAGRTGLGCAVLVFLVTGALGNGANAIYYGAAHSSVGASTGVFGLVGVLAGLAAWRRHRLHRARRGAWVALAAGLGVVAMLGGPGPRVDFSAHLFGLIVGAAAGLTLSIPLGASARPGSRAQAVAWAASFALVFGAWRMA